MTDQPKISLAQWCAYLPYDLNILINNKQYRLDMYDMPFVAVDIRKAIDLNARPLLRPMNKENQAAINDICSKYNLSFDDCFYCDGKPYGDEANFEIVTTEELPYGLVQELLQNHYDLDGLIPQGLALPIE